MTSHQPDSPGGLAYHPPATSGARVLARRVAADMSAIFAHAPQPGPHAEGPSAAVRAISPRPGGEWIGRAGSIAAIALLLLAFVLAATLAFKSSRPAAPPAVHGSIATPERPRLSLRGVLL